MIFSISKKIKAVLVIFLSAIFLCNAPCFSVQISKAAEKRQGWLFVQAAASGTFKKIKGDSKHYRLILKGVSPTMIAFTDRPARKGRIRTVGSFVSHWKSDKGRDNYRKNPPNASLVLSSSGFEDVMVISLKSPKYNLKKQTLSYKVKFIELINNHRQGNLQVPLRTTVPKKFRKVVLFIDDSWSSLGG